MEALPKIRTEINPTTSSLSSSLRSLRRPPPSLTLLDATPGCRRVGREEGHQKISKRRRWKNLGNRDSRQAWPAEYSALEYHYHPMSRDESGEQRTFGEEEDHRTFIDWLFLRPFRCKYAHGRSNKLNDIAAIFSTPGMPSAAELLCGSIDRALVLEQVLACALHIVSDSNVAIADELENLNRKPLSEISFKAGSGPIIRYINGDKLILPTTTGIVSEEAFNTVKKICGFDEDGGSSTRGHVFTKQEMMCPISHTLHHVELRSTSHTEEIAFRLGRRTSDVESKTVVADACHRFLATSISGTAPFSLLITGFSGKSTILREFREALSKSNGFHRWNIIDGNKLSKYTSSRDDFSSCLQSYVKEVASENARQTENVIVFDDLSVEHGFPIVQDMARVGIHVIATMGNGCNPKDNLFNLTKALTRSDDCPKAMVLEIQSDKNDAGNSCSNRNERNLRKRKMNCIESRYKLIIFGSDGKSHKTRRLG